MAAAEFVIRRNGTIEGIYSDKVPFRALAAALGGTLTTARASHVEPTEDGRWTADMAPSCAGKGVMLGPFDTRQEALDAEVQWLRRNVLGVE